MENEGESGLESVVFQLEPVFITEIRIPRIDSRFLFSFLDSSTLFLIRVDVYVSSRGNTWLVARRLFVETTISLMIKRWRKINSVTLEKHLKNVKVVKKCSPRFKLDSHLYKILPPTGINTFHH